MLLAADAPALDRAMPPFPPPAEPSVVFRLANAEFGRTRTVKRGSRALFPYCAAAAARTRDRENGPLLAL